jgi:hypothetical protein
MVDVIYCGKGNVKLDSIAVSCGFKYGLRLPQIKYLDVDLFFADQDWKYPKKCAYMQSLRKYTPKLVTVVDIEHREQLDIALEWADTISSMFTTTIVFIPKCTGIINKIPRQIGNCNARLGYSVPTDYGATTLSPKFFNNWPVHLLGGSPHKQLAFRDVFDVVSVDCNYHSMKANRFAEYWTGQKGHLWEKVNPNIDPQQRSYTAFDVSCRNILAAWNFV